MISKEYMERVLAIAADTKFFEMYPGAIYEVAEVFKKAFPAKRALVVADAITWSICGKEMTCHIQESRLPSEYHLISDDHFKAELKYVEEIEEALEEPETIAIAVGSGAINDLCKLASYRAGKQYLCFPTAASVDGYTAFNASIFVNGVKTTFECPAPRVVVADTAIIASAPKSTTAAGYADLAAKIISGAEWILGDFVGREPINSDAWHALQDVLDISLCRPKKVAEGDHNALDDMFKALCLSGMSMQLVHSSRPASGTEHLFSHYLDMIEHSFNGRRFSHGFQVGVGTLIMCRLFEKFLAADFTTIDVDALVAKWPTLEQEQAEADRLFADFVKPDLGRQIAAEKYYTKDEVRQILTKIKAKWPDLQARLRGQVYTYKHIHRLLRRVGAPSKAADLGLNRRDVRKILSRLRLMRNRVSLLDIAKMLDFKLY